MEPLVGCDPIHSSIILQEMILLRHERCYRTWQEPNCLPHRVPTSLWCDCISWWSESGCLRTWEIEKNWSRKCCIQWQVYTASIVLPAITLLSLLLCMLWNSLEEKSVFQICFFSTCVYDDLSKAEMLFSFFLILCCSKHIPSTFNTTKEFW